MDFDIPTDIAAFLEELDAFIDDKIKPLDNFFHVGGDSLGLVCLQTKIKESMHLEVNMADLFRFASIRDLAKYLDQHKFPLTSTNSNNEIKMKHKKFRRFRGG